MTATPQSSRLGTTMPSAATTPSVQYVQAAQRHMRDADALRALARLPGAGQLFGFGAECGLKALLIACGVMPDAKGEIPRGTFRQHVPILGNNIVAHGHLIPDGVLANQYLAPLVHVSKFNDWSTDHRYWKDSAVPTASVEGWRTAAMEILEMVDRAKQAGVVA